ncbi:MAG: multicopper oxidase domain-containing protein [Chloroflexi bacterium]|nr:multicopper oxidase domain-containing protein [Chloroflexota bacterium]
MVKVLTDLLGRLGFGRVRNMPPHRDVVIVASLLAVGVVAWGYLFHTRVLGEEDVSLRGPLVHLATDGLLAFPVAFLATVLGLWCAGRWGSRLKPGRRLLLGAGLVTLFFGIVLPPSVLLHGYLDTSVFGEWSIPHGAEDQGLLGLLLHALRDALLSLAVVPPMAVVGLALAVLAGRKTEDVEPSEEPVGPAGPVGGSRGLFEREANRREVLKYGGAGATVLALQAAGLVSWPAFVRTSPRATISSPSVEPFRLPLRIAPVIQPLRSVRTRDFANPQDLLTLAEQGIEIGEEADFYVVRQMVSHGEILPGLRTTFWGYNGMTPGPTFRVREGRPAIVRQVNELPVRTATHLHGADAPAASDGRPIDLVAPAPEFARPLGAGEATGCGEEPGEEEFATLYPGFQDHFYPNIQEAEPLWYHDHAMHRTGRNVYMGLAGFYLMEDAQEQSLPLPRGRFDIPLVIQDKLFARDGSLVFPCNGDIPERQGVFGDVILVNGTPMPFLRVARHKYRFRLLNGSTARVYRLALSTGDPLIVIASDGGLLASPAAVEELSIAMSERYEVVIDFARYPIGTKVVLENHFEPAFGDNVDAERTRRVMRFDVVEDAEDRTSIPDDLRPLRPLPVLPESSAVRTRDFRFERQGGFWAINGKIFEKERFDAEPKLGDVEIWRFINKAGGWVHPVHPHLVEFRTLDRNGERPRPEESGRKDSILLGENQEIRVIMKFQHFKGPYVFHCHNIEHEDHDMMTQFRVV